MVFTGLSSEKMIMVGAEDIPYRSVVSGLSSMLTLATATRLANSSARSASIGAIILHGPHQAAQKSTSTRMPESSTSAANEASVTLFTFTAFSGSKFRTVRLGRLADRGLAPRRRQLATLDLGQEEAARGYRRLPLAERRTWAGSAQR